MKWTQAQIDMLVKLRDEGKTITQCAAKLKRSRGSVSGFIGNNKSLFFSSSGFSKGKTIKDILFKKPKQGETIIESPPKSVPLPERYRPVRFIDRKPNQCSFILESFWDEPNKESFCCGNPVMNSKAIEGNLEKTNCEYHMNWSIEKND